MDGLSACGVHCARYNSCIRCRVRHSLMSGLSGLSRSRVGAVEKSTGNSTLYPLLGGTQSATGLAINQSTAVSVSTVYACVSIRSKDVARCSPRLMKEEAARADKPNTTHPVAKLFKRPNAWQTWT